MPGITNIAWTGDARTGHLRLLDQTRLPTEQVYLDCTSVQEVWDAIRRLSVRGAPAIGIAAAFGCVLAIQPARDEADAAARLKQASAHLAASRPTAVNLFWALARMQRVAPCTPDALLAEAKRIHAEDAAMCQKIGEHTLELFRRHAVSAKLGEPLAILTHCNAGALATGGIGTATAGMYLAQQQGMAVAVYADETRPLLQGSRLTAFELAAAGVDVTLICDDMAAHVMQRGRVQMIITGADRIAANGDTANKIGTYNLAVLAKHHGLPFYVAAPSSTFDLDTPNGQAIPIEERASEEITHGFGKPTAPPDAKTYSPAFDVTPAALISAIVTERGLVEPVNAERIVALIGGH